MCREKPFNLVLYYPTVDWTELIDETNATDLEFLVIPFPNTL